MPRIANFSGGLNKRLDPTRVPNNQGVEFKNIDNSSGILKSAKNNKVLPEVGMVQVSSVSPEKTQFAFYPAGFFSNTPAAISAAIYLPRLKFGRRRQYELDSIELRQEQGAINFYISGDIRIPADENYQIQLTTLGNSPGESPSVITVFTKDGVFSDPRDTPRNNIGYTLTEAQLTPFAGKAFGIRVSPVSLTDNNPLLIDNNEVLTRLGGKTFAREIGSSVVEYNNAAYFTRGDDRPQKVYNSNRSLIDVSFTANQGFSSEQVFITGRLADTNSKIELNSSNELVQTIERSAVIAGRFGNSTRSKVSGSKILHRTRANYIVETEAEARGDSYTTTTGGDIADLGFGSNVADYESITNYDFYLTRDKRLYLDNIIYIDLSSISGNSSNWLISVLHYPINYTPDPTKNNEQNLNASRENITQTRILLYKGDGTGHVISFTRDATAADNKLSFIRNGTPIGDLTEDLSNSIGQHILKGVDSNDNLNTFENKVPLFATVVAAGDMTLISSDNTSSIQVNRRLTGSNLFYSIGVVRAGAVIPTGYNRSRNISTYNIDRTTGALTKIRDELVRCPIALNAQRVTLGYLGVDNGARITSPIGNQTLVEDLDNLSSIRPLGIEQPESKLRLSNYTEFDANRLRFPSASLIGADSKYRTASRRGGQSTRPARPASRNTYEDALDINVRVVINQKNRVFRDLEVLLEDEALVAEQKDICVQKGSRGLFGIGSTLRIECHTEYTNLRRTGATLDFTNFYIDNEVTDTFDMDIGVQYEGTYYKIGTVTRDNPTVTFEGFVSYTNPNDVSSTATHTRTLSRPNLEDGTLAPELVAGTESATSTCSVRYIYTFYDELYDIEGLPAVLSSDTIAIDATGSIRLDNFNLPSSESTATHIRLYRICPEKGETKFTLISQIPLTDEEPVYVDNLGSADLGGLKYNDEGQLVYEERNADGSLRGTHIIVNADGTRHNPSDSFTEQWNNYINATGKILDSQENGQPPQIDEQNIKHLIVVRGTLVGIIGQRIYWSRVGYPDYWPAQNFLDFSEEVTGIIEIANGLLVFTRNETHLISNFPDPNNISRTIISNQQGCIHIRTPQFIRGVPVWVSNDGICTFIPGGLTATSIATRQNGRVDVISRGLLGDTYLKGNIITTEVHNDVYYILYNDRIVSMDQRYINALQSGVEQIATNFVEYDTNGVRFFEKFDGEDTFYGTTNRNIVEMFAGTEDLVMEYLSPVITLSADERIKRFNDLYVAYTNKNDAETEGNLNLTTILHGYQLTRNVGYALPKTHSVIERHIEGGTWYGIQFRIVGKGTVSAIGYTATSSQKKRTGGGS